jgi:predicted amidophosphoribosyltransferase
MRGSPAVIRRLCFASCYVYSPVGTGRISQHSRLLRSLLKAANPRFIEKYAVRVHQQVDSGSMALRGYFGDDDILVPVPGSEAGGINRAWGAAHLADALVSEGLGRAAWRGLKRNSRVPKSAYALSGARPSLGRHYDSFALATPLCEPHSIVLIDDIVTKGRTLLAAAVRLHEAFPRAHIKAFALVRTMGLVSEVNCLLDPCRGEIRWRHGDAMRRP